MRFLATHLKMFKIKNRFTVNQVVMWYLNTVELSFGFNPLILRIFTSYSFFHDIGGVI